ncbi:MAG: D-2-hydroxyacid dehydrogenase [Clostridiales bacterium]|nr:D-2-hydroxyacid dehydrogenase [Clostridiales bacterium]
MKIVVLERNSVGLDIDLSLYEKYGEVVYYPNTVKEDAAEKVKDADIIIANKAPMNEETLKDAANVKLICEFATGYDNVDLEYCKKRGIKVANVVDYSTAAVAQHTFALALYLSESMNYYDRYVKSGTYGAQARFSHFDVPFTELEGKTWGIIGMGNIGRKVAKIAEAFGCKVIFYSASGKSTCTDYKRVELDELLKKSDYLSVHCPLSNLTRNLIDLDAMKKMKRTAYLINVARGPVVNNADLYQALEEGYIAGAGLDVLEKEPIQKENPLGEIQDSSKLIITPHMAWASTEARTRLVEEVAKNIEAFLNGENRNIVNL